MTIYFATYDLRTDLLEAGGRSDRHDLRMYISFSVPFSVHAHGEHAELVTEDIVCKSWELWDYTTGKRLLGSGRYTELEGRAWVATFVEMISGDSTDAVNLRCEVQRECLKSLDADTDRGWKERHSGDAA
jgi:hypothetical protein